MTDAELARRMYQAYNDQGPYPWKTFDGRSVPSWDEISDQVRGKWGAAAQLARLELSKIATDYAAELDDNGEPNEVALRLAAAIRSPS